MAFIERLPFSYLHVFSFSQRPGTSAADHADQVPAPVIKSRARELRALSDAKSKGFRRSQAGRVLRVLTLRQSQDSSETTPALSSNYLQLQLHRKLAANEWVSVLVSERDDHTVGEVIDVHTCCL